MSERPIVVRVRCTWQYTPDERCYGNGPGDHVHQPTPCANHQDDRHHAYTLPKSVTLDIGGQLRRVRFTP